MILYTSRIGATQRYYDLLAQGIFDIQELSITHEAVSKAKTEVLHHILTHQRDEIEAIADRLLADHPDYRLLRTVPGIGPIVALTILAEAGNLRRFGHHRQFVTFCGLDLATHQSGQFRGQPPSRSSATHACVAPYGWQPKWPSGSGRTASATSSSATSRRTGTTPTFPAKSSSPLLPRWHA